MTTFRSPRLESRATACAIAFVVASTQAAPPDAPPAAKVTVVTSFGTRIGDVPNAVIAADDGRLYGTSWGDVFHNLEMIFRVTSTGRKKLLHQFRGDDGRLVQAALLEASDGALYGSATAGANGWGDVFRITKDGSFSVLHAMKADASEGSGSPYPLIQARDGLLYGASMRADDVSEGTLYRISLDGNFSVVAAFSTDMIWPSGPPLEGDDGNFYLTMNAGGSHNGGGLLSVTPDGVVTDLADFPEGNWPVGGLAYDAAHEAMYGVTMFGTVYRYRNGQVERLGTFDGCGSISTPTLGPDGVHFYVACGADVRSFTADGEFKIVARTPGHSGLRLAFDAKGALYGTTSDGGARGRGTVFRITRY